MKIAIPSKARPDIITLDLLKSNEIYIFVEPQDLNDYKKYKGRVKKIVNIEKNDQGIVYVRNFILDYFKQGDEVMMLDDDIQGFYRMAGKEVVKIGIEDTMKLFEQSFKICQNGGSKLWGLYPIANAFYMSCKNPINVKGFIIATACGIVVSDLRFEEEAGLKEDYDFTMQHIKKFGKVLRWNCYAVKAKHYKNKGGLTEIRTKEKEKKVCDYLKKKYPGAIVDNPRRENEVLIRINKVKEV